MQLIDHSELVAVMRRNGAKAKDYAQRHQVPKWYDQCTRRINCKSSESRKTCLCRKADGKVLCRMPTDDSHLRRSECSTLYSVDTMTENWRVNPEIAGGGYFFDLAAHQLDYLDYVFGPIQSVTGTAGNQAGLYPGLVAGVSPSMKNPQKMN